MVCDRQRGEGDSRAGHVFEVSQHLVERRLDILRAFVRQVSLNPDIPGPAKLGLLNKLLRLSNPRFAKLTGLAETTAEDILSGNILLAPEEYERLMLEVVEGHIGKQVAKNFQPYKDYTRIDSVYFVTSLYRRLIELGLLPKSDYFEDFHRLMASLGFVKVPALRIYLHKESVLQLLKLMREELKTRKRGRSDNKQCEPTRIHF